MCIEQGGFAVDLPDGKYHVFLNLDSPSGFWGEYQTYRKRTVKANGVPVVQDTMDLPRFLQKYFRYADVEDRPEDNTFDKYQRTYFQEKEFDADVKNGQLTLDFEGEAYANTVSALVIYPASQAKLGKQYLANLRERRRFYFDNYFKRGSAQSAPGQQGRHSRFRAHPTGTKAGVRAVCPRPDGGRSHQRVSAPGRGSQTAGHLRGCRTAGTTGILSSRPAR